MQFLSLTNCCAWPQWSLVRLNNWIICLFFQLYFLSYLTAGRRHSPLLSCLVWTASNEINCLQSVSSLLSGSFYANIKLSNILLRLRMLMLFNEEKGRFPQFHLFSIYNVVTLLKQWMIYLIFWKLHNYISNYKIMNTENAFDFWGILNKIK